MTVYVVAYYDGGQWNMSGLILNLAEAQNAYNWFQTLSGTTYAVILSWNATSVATWGTPPA